MVCRYRRRWSAEEKRSICLQASAPGVSVAQVARRYSMNANLIFKWLRDARFAPTCDGDAGRFFLPVEIDDAMPVDMSAAATGGLPAEGIHIELAGGHRIVAGGGFDAERLGRLLKAWLS
jgi:transposase